MSQVREGCRTTTSRSSAMAVSRDEDGREIEIDERWFAEWVELGFRLIRTRLDAEDEMDKIDRQRGESNGSQEPG